MNIFEPKPLVAFIRTECKKNRVQFYHSRWNNVSMGTQKSSGYFISVSNGKGKLAFGRNKFLTMAHEYCHMRQWIEKTQIWKDGNIGCNIIFPWIDGKEFKKNVIQKAIISTFNLEKDCEQRTVKLLRQFGYKDITEYIQKSNAYILFYFSIMENRKWYSPKTAPYDMKEVWSKMPKTFNYDPNKTYDRLKNLFELCIGH